MNIGDYCDHKEVFYRPRPHDEVPLYVCNSCKSSTLYNVKLGGTLDMRQYLPVVLAFNGLKLVRK